MKLLVLFFIGLAPLVLLIPLFMLLLNLMIYGLQNRNICSKASLNVKSGILLGVLIGPLGMLIVLTKAVKPTIKNLIFGISRVLLIVAVNWVIIKAANLDIVCNILSPLFIYVIGITFVLRGKNSFKLSASGIK
ncbi:MAG: hypothetical protein CMD38_03740 [Flavobacteriales bacterium]|nr:hypothetical protein [Flavobacteriales bacterium]